MTQTTQDHPDGWAGFNYDHRAPQVSYAPHDLWARLREQKPVVHSDAYGGFWLVTRYEDVMTVLADATQFTADEGVNIPRQNMVMLPGEVDPPLHRQYRKIVNPPLSPKVVRAFEPWIRELAESWVAKVKARGEFDAMADFCEPYAKRVSMRAIGFPEEDLDRLDHWTHVLSVGVRDDEEGKRVSEEFFGYLGAALEARSPGDDYDDVIQAITDGQVDGRPVTDQEKVSLLIQITFGGLHTTSVVLGGALFWLARHPEDRVRLLNEPELMSTAIEEFVRYITPVPHSNRAAKHDLELRGCPIKAKERVMFCLGSANYDESMFDDPYDVVLDRFPNKHVGFGAGPHRCAGSHLGRLGVQVGLETFLREIPEYEVTDYYAIRYGAGEGRALLNLPLRVGRTTGGTK